MSSTTEGSGGRLSLHTHAGSNQLASPSEGEASGGHSASHGHKCTETLSKKVRQCLRTRAAKLRGNMRALPFDAASALPWHRQPFLIIVNRFATRLLAAHLLMQQIWRGRRYTTHRAPSSTTCRAITYQQVWYLLDLPQFVLNNNLVVMQACTTCGATDTPMWRNGACGPKTLCNACGEQAVGLCFPARWHA